MLFLFRSSLCVVGAFRWVVDLCFTFDTLMVNCSHKKCPTNWHTTCFFWSRICHAWNSFHWPSIGHVFFWFWGNYEYIIVVFSGNYIRNVCRIRLQWITMKIRYIRVQFLVLSGVDSRFMWCDLVSFLKKRWKNVKFYDDRFLWFIFT